MLHGGEDVTERVGDWEKPYDCWSLIPIPHSKHGATVEQIRLLRREDVADLVRLCFPELPPDEVRERVEEDVALQERGDGVTLVAEEAGRAGMTAKLLRSGEVGWIFNVSAHDAFRGRGILQRLFAELEEHARKMGLTRLAIHVREDNLRARRAYEKAGFRRVGAEGMQGTQLRYEKKLA